MLFFVFVSSYCTNSENQTKIPDLSEDEEYLVEAYTGVIKASEGLKQGSVTYLKSESLFATLDSTIDTLRIANTIRHLETDPERWILVLGKIEQQLKSQSQGGRSEGGR